MITFELTEDLAMIQRTALDFATEKIRPANRAAEAAGRVPDEIAQQFIELGFSMVDISADAGGLGLGLVGRTVVEEALAFGDLAVAMGMPGPSALGPVLALLGNDSQRQRWLSPLLEGGRGAIAWNDAKPRAGELATIAIEQPDHSWRLDGMKSEIVAGDRATAIAVFAQAHHLDGKRSPAAFMIDPKSDGVRVGAPGHQLGLDAARVVTMTLEHVHVSAKERLEGAGDQFESRTIEAIARCGVVGAARATGLARAAFETAREYAEDRKAFGKPIAHFQGLAFLIADMATRVEVMNSFVRRAAVAMDAGEEARVELAAMAIAECHEGAMFVADNAVQVLGGSGFIRDFPVEKWMRDAKAHMAYALPHQLCDLIVGRRALESSAFSFAEDAPMPGLQPVMI